MSVYKILKISIMILFAFVFTEAALGSCPDGNAPVITSPNDNEVYLAGANYTDLCKATGDAVITWSGPGEFDPTTGCCSDYNAPGTTGTVTITATNSHGSDQVKIGLADIIYVDEDATGNDDGTSWIDAFDTLQEGLAAAASGNHIWVAEGTYKPGAAKLDTFHLVPGVQVYGGFDPTVGDDLWAERDYINNVTTLSGDIDDDGLDSDNSYFVVTANDVTIDGSTRLDGFTITMGWSYHHLCDGAGMKIENCDPNVANCIFKENKAPGDDGDGGGMGCMNASPEVTNCLFIDNIAGDDGGALVNTYGSNGTFTNCVFYNNQTLGDNQGKSNGGAIWNTASEKAVPIGSSPTFINCVIANNSTTNDGGGAANSGADTDPTYINCTFYGNVADDDGTGYSKTNSGGGMANKDGSDTTVTNCIFWDNVAEDEDNEIHTDGSSDVTVTYSDVEGGHEGMGNINSEPKFFDTDDIDGPDNLFMTLDDGLEIGSDSLCIDAGNNTPVTESYDIIERTRIIDGDEDSTTTVDMGAYEFQPITEKGPYLLFTGTNTEMMVRWQLNQDRNCTIEWGTTPGYGYSAQVDDDVAFPGEYLFRHTITGLTVGTKYYYRVRGVGSGTFYSAPASDATAVKFLAYGDSRGPSNGTLSPEFDNVCASMIDAYTTDSGYQTFTLHAGDLIYTGSTESHWTNQYFNRTDNDIMEMLANLPAQACLGNHERNNGGAGEPVYRKYLPYYDLFMNDTYDCGSFDYGPAHFIVIDDYYSESTTLSSSQLNWINNDLNNTSKEWKFIMFHAPGFSAAGGHNNNPDVNKTNGLQDLCETHGIDIVFCGHNHYYARCEVNGVVHITTGGGGAELRTPNPNYHPSIVETDESNHFCKIRIDGDDLYFEAIDVFDTPPIVPIDSFEIHH